MSSDDRMNILVVVSDTLRTAYLGCYGNPTIRTPNIDRFAASGAIFTQAYPESLPTIPVRRALHSGQQAYPFRNYRPVPWDIVYLPGWQPMDDAQPTLAEDIAAAGYHTGFVTDALPYFAPAFNFTRGFRQWEFIRGKQQDRWRSVYAADPQRVAGMTPINPQTPYNHVNCHVANTDGLMDPEKTCTARTFRWAMQFLADNAAVPFYLLVDVFDPHEPWEAPQEYYRMYADGSYAGLTTIHTRYDRDLAGLSEAQVADIVAHYSGLVSLVDHWFGKLMDRLDDLKLADRTLVIFLSDHGTNFGDNIWRVMGKPGWALFPGTMHIPLIVRHPGGAGAGQRIAGLRYNLDVTATAYDAAGVGPSQPIDGMSLLPKLHGDTTGDREYLTSRFGDTVWYRDDRWWVFCSVTGEDPHVFNVQDDPACAKDLGDDAREAFDLAWRRILADAGGELPDYRGRKQTDAVGQKQS